MCLKFYELIISRYTQIVGISGHFLTMECLIQKAGESITALYCCFPVPQPQAEGGVEL